MGKNFILALLIGSGLVLGACDGPVKNKTKDTDIFSVMKENPEQMIDVLITLQEYQQAKQLEQKWNTETEKSIDYRNTPMLGSKDAKNTILVYYSYLCGYCSKVQERVDQIMLVNPDTKVYFKIVNSDEQSMKTAAVFNYLAKTDIKLALEFNNEIFMNQGEYFKNPEKTVKDVLSRLDINHDVLKKSMTSEYKKLHEANIEEYKNNNCEGTPTFIVNNKYSVAGTADINIFKKALAQ